MKIEIHNDENILAGDYEYLEGGVENGIPSFHISLALNKGKSRYIYFYFNDKNEYDEFMETISKCIDFNSETKLILPKNNLKKQKVLEPIAKRFEANKNYSETEVNEIIKEFNVEDYVLFRRELINFGYLDRDPYKEIYWLKKK